MKSDYLSVKQSSTKQTGQNGTKRLRTQDSTTTTSDGDLAPLSPKAQRLSAKTSVIQSPQYCQPDEMRFTIEQPTFSGAGPKPINPVVDLTLSSSSSGGVTLPRIAMSSPATPLMGPPARVGTKSQQPTAEFQPTTGTRPVIEDVKEPVQHSPERSGGTIVLQKQSLTPKSPAGAPSSSKPKQVFPNVQEWSLISSERDKQSPPISQQPQPQHSKMRISKQKKQKKILSPDINDVDDDSNSNSSRN